MKTKTKTITGHTRNAYKAAVKDALYGSGCRMHNPAVKYCTERGFFVESALTDNRETERTIWEANFSANTGKPYCLPRYEDLDI